MQLEDEASACDLKWRIARQQGAEAKYVTTFGYVHMHLEEKGCYLHMHLKANDYSDSTKCIFN